MNDSVSTLEHALAERHGRRQCFMTGRASSALHIAFRSLEGEGRRIVFPAILCPQPASVALNAGFEPLFCDVSAHDANLDPDALESLLERTEGVIAVVVAHLYGEAAQIERIVGIAKRFGVAVIEDAAQVMGATLGGRPLGSFGDMSVLSFGHTKIIDTGGGGAILTDSDDLAEKLARAAAELPPRPENFDELSGEYRTVYYRLKAMADESPRLNRLFLPLPDIYRDLYVYSFEPGRADDLRRRLDGLEQEVAARRRKADIYEEHLRTTAVTRLRRTGEGVPWRYNVLLPPQRQREITGKLRDAGFDASNWYPALPRWFDSGRRQDQLQFRNARKIESGILNLWLDRATDEPRVESCARKLASLARPYTPAARGTNRRRWTLK